MSFNNIPAEMQQLKQWVVWQYEDTDQFKPTKVPYNARTSYHASNTNPATWSTFEQACAVAHNVSGIGFALCDTDSLSCIDLDDPYELLEDGSYKYTNRVEIAERQMRIAAAFDSYSEISPSNKGLHIWVHGKVPSGRKKEGVEIYSTARYMTMTGNVFNSSPIKEYNEKLNSLWVEMRSPKESITVNGDSKPQTQSDYDILKTASEAVNGQKFIDLYEGRWQQYYNDDPNKISCNESDQGLINIIAFYTQNHEQIARIFRASALGKRLKAQRDNYLFDPRYGAITKAFDRQPAQVDLDELKNEFEAQFAAIKEQIKALPEAPKAPVFEPVAPTLPVTLEAAQKPSRNDPYTLPPGLLGEMAKFFYDASPIPVPEMALAAAIGLMAGICGRCYNVSGTGLNQYILVLGNTGSGKDAMGKCIDRLMQETMKTVPACSEFIGPGEIASSQALVKYLDKVSPGFITLAGEVTLLLKQLHGLRPGTHELGLKRIILQLFGASGQGCTYKPLIYSDATKNTKSILNPAFTILGESTPEEFYEMLNEEMIRSGFIPRFTIIEYKGKRHDLNENHRYVKPCPQLVERFAMLCAQALSLNNGNNVQDVGQDEKATKLLRKFRHKCNDALNGAANEVQRHLWNRSHLKSLRLAALLAVGVNYINPVITEVEAMWAINLVENDVSNLLQRFETGEIGAPSVHNEQHDTIKKGISKYLKSDWSQVEKWPGSSHATWHNKVIPHSFITAYCRAKLCFKTDRPGPLPAIKAAIASLMDSGDLVEVPLGDKKARALPLNGRIYAVSNVKEFI